MGTDYDNDLARGKDLMDKGFNHRFDMVFEIDQARDFRSIVRLLKVDLCDVGVEIIISRKDKGLMIARNVPQPLREFVVKYMPGELVDEENV